MSDQAGFQITPEEDRFLRAFFRRQAGRYLLGVGLLAVLAVWGVAQRGGEAVAPDPAQQQELAGLRAENAKLRAELGELSQHVAQLAAAPDPTKPMGELAERVAGALRRLDRVESRIEELPAGGAPGQLADASGVLERLYNLESRQQREEKSRETFEKSVLTRLYAVEDGRDSITEASTSTQQSILGRLDALESRAAALERGLSSQAVPAAPEP